MNYDEATDFEINKAVAKTITECFSMRMIGDSKKFNYLEVRVGIEFNPCNNPADMHPISLEHKIARHWAHTDVWKAIITNQGKPGAYGVWEHYDTNPLRAEAIVYLKMMEKEKDNGN